MKRYSVVYLMVTLVALVSACQKSVPSPEQADVARTITFKACVPELQGATKAEFGTKKPGGYPVKWTGTDKAGVSVDYATEYQTVTIEPGENVQEGTFTATITPPSAGAFKVQATVPASFIVGYDATGSTVEVSIPASQRPSAGSPDSGAIFLVAEKEFEAAPAGDEPVLLPFKHATAYGCISLTNLPTDAEIHSIDLIASVPISGKWKYCPETGAMTPGVSANIITVHTASATNVFFGCAPADLEGQTLKIRLNTAAGIWETTVSITSALKFTAGTLANFSVDMSGSTKKTSISILGIGHSFTMDAMQYLYQPLAELGYTDIALGRLVKSNCKLLEHVQYYNENTPYPWAGTNLAGSWV